MELLTVVWDAMADSIDAQMLALLGPDRYHRIQIDLAPENVNLDDGSLAYFRLLSGAARGYVDSTQGQAVFNAALEAIAD